MRMKRRSRWYTGNGTKEKMETPRCQNELSEAIAAGKRRAEGLGDDETTALIMDPPSESDTTIPTIAYLRAKRHAEKLTRMLQMEQLIPGTPPAIVCMAVVGSCAILRRCCTSTRGTANCCSICQRCCTSTPGRQLLHRLAPPLNPQPLAARWRSRDAFPSRLRPTPHTLALPRLQTPAHRRARREAARRVRIRVPHPPPPLQTSKLRWRASWLSFTT